MIQKITNVMERIKDFFRRIFVKKDNLLTEAKENISDAKSYLCDKFEQERQIIELQNKYEKGEIKETELSQEQKELLIELYEKQIQGLEERKQQCERDINYYKEQIIQAIKAK